MGLVGMRSVSVDPDLVAKYDAVLIVTDHTEIDWQSLTRAAKLIVDTRNATANVSEGREKIFSA
jgi:UDP-N-acetyl-D-glucosamine dehydrogenase